jgi:hypothetical protein
MRTDWIFRTVVEIHLSPRLTMPLVEKVGSPGAVVAVAEVVQVLAVMAEVFRLTSPRISFHRISFVGEPIMQFSSATSVLIQVIWVKIEVPILQTRME